MATQRDVLIVGLTPTAGTAPPGISGTEGRSAAQRSDGAQLAPRWLLGLISVAVVLAVLEVVSRAGLIAASEFPAPSRVFATFIQQLQLGSFWDAVGTTTEAWFYGLLIASAIAIPVGMLIGSSYLTFRASRVPIEFLRPIPAVAIIPLAVLVYGISLKSTLLLVVFGSVWPILVQSSYGVRDIDPVTKETARCYGLSRRHRIRHVLVPSAMPYIATGLRVASSVALILAVTAELVIGGGGLGAAIATAQSGDSIRLIYALILATGLIGLAINVVFRASQHRLLRWLPENGQR